MGRSHTTETVVEFRVCASNRDATNSATDVMIFTVHAKVSGAEVPAKSMKGQRETPVAQSTNR
jgi:hypothetical protein